MKGEKGRERKKKRKERYRFKEKKSFMEEELKRVFEDKKERQRKGKERDTEK